MKFELPKYRDFRRVEDNLFQSVPVTWSIKRLKFVMSEVTVGIVITPSKYYVDKGVAAIRSLNVKEGRLTDNDLVSFSEADTRKLAKTRIYKGDIVIVRTGETGASAVVDQRFDGANCIDLIIVRKSRHLRSEYLQYFLASAEAAAEIKMNSNGAIQQHFNIGLVRELTVLQPPDEDQDAIIAFLDSETAKIDRVTEIRRRQVERLQEQRIAIIHRAVTKGINPNASLKSSGVEWIQECPVHWETWPIKRVAQIVTGNTPSRGNIGYYSEDGMPWIKPEDLNGFVPISNSSELLSEAGQKEVRVVPEGTIFIGGIGNIGKFGIAGTKCATNQQIHSLILEGKLTADYFKFVVSATSREMMRQSNKVVVSILNKSQLGIIRITVPPEEEQRSIVAHIGHATAKIDTLISKYTRELGLLAEYRTSLISHAVTGKIDVRDLAQTEEPKLAIAL